MDNCLWKPTASIELLKERAHGIQQIRHFFSSRGYLEVETPYLSHYGVTDVYIDNIEVPLSGETYYLQTSPEYHMKRLLAAGSGPIFQLARVFRDDELGRWHNPEFTLLEWYQLNIDHHGLMEEVDLFLQILLDCPPCHKISYQKIFCEICGVDPFKASLAELRAVLQRFELSQTLEKNEMETDQYLFLLMSRVIEPALADYEQPTIIYHFPPSQAALAKIHHGVAERFEVYYRGIELANGFHELQDSSLQRKRFKQDIQIRQAKGLKIRQADENFLHALDHGLPPCSGVALGIDRLFALKFKQPALAPVLAFDFSIA